MEYLKKLCEELEIASELESSKEGGSLLPIDSLTIEIRSLKPGTYFRANICKLPKETKEDLLVKLMKANLFGQGTMGMTIGLNQESDLTLSYAMPYDMDYRTFKESVEDFANIVDYWAEEIETHQKLAEGGIL